MLTKISCGKYDQLGLWKSNLANVSDGPSMLDAFEACSSMESFEARFVAAQQNNARTSFQEINTTKIGKELALIEMKINGEKKKS